MNILKPEKERQNHTVIYILGDQGCVGRKNLPRTRDVLHGVKF